MQKLNEKIQRIENPTVLHRVAFDLRNDFGAQAEKYGQFWFVQPSKWAWVCKDRAQLVSNHHCKGKGIFLEVQPDGHMSEFTPTDSEKGINQ